MRGLRTNALGGHFIAPHKSMLFLFHLGSPWALFQSSLEVLRARLNVPEILFAAQAAPIRIGVFFFVRK